MLVVKIQYAFESVLTGGSMYILINKYFQCCDIKFIRYLEKLKSYNP